MFVKTETRCDDDDECDDVGFAVDGLETNFIDIREGTEIDGKKYGCCSPSDKKKL